MKIREIIFWILVLVSVVVILWYLFGTVSAVEVNYCCEKTISGAWCINAPESECNKEFRNAPASCEATSYCKLGCCYDSQEGTCMENTPQKVCQDNGGVWDASAECEIPQCSLGCCLIGDQAAFVTQTRCKRLSSLYGLEIDFRTDISSELSCIASATSDVKGACIFEKDFEKTCRFITKKECLGTSASNGTKFYEGKLCSNEALGTNCGPSKKTTCVEGKDGVYFVDSCGNLANIYDASKINDKNYWGDVYRIENSCGYGSSNAGSSACGNCDYYLGSTCKESKIGGSAKYGSNTCADLSCKWEGKAYQHGETWCADAKGISKITAEIKKSDNSKENLPGSRYFRAVCYNGDVTIEPCADYRQEVCIQSDIGGFKTAACRVNMWQDCYAQDNKKDCENSDKRDCQWVEGISLNSNQKAEETKSTVTGAVISEGTMLSPSKGACVPLFAPGFNFWEANSEAESMCSMASAQCVVTFAEKPTGKRECVDNCECTEESWAERMNQACIAVGDCGSSVNYIGVQGYHDGKTVKVESVKKEGEKK